MFATPISKREKDEEKEIVRCENESLMRARTITPGMVSPSSFIVIPRFIPKTTIVLVIVVPMLAPSTMGTPNLIADSMERPPETILDMETIVAATTALLL